MYHAAFPLTDSEAQAIHLSRGCYSWADACYGVMTDELVMQFDSESDMWEWADAVGDMRFPGATGSLRSLLWSIFRAIG